MAKKIFDMIKICPKCGSTNIVTKINRHSGPTFFCNDCKYGENLVKSTMGNFFPEIDMKDVEKFRKDLKKYSDAQN